MEKEFFCVIYGDNITQYDCDEITCAAQLGRFPYSTPVEKSYRTISIYANILVLRSSHTSVSVTS